MDKHAEAGFAPPLESAFARGVGGGRSRRKRSEKEEKDCEIT